MATVQNIIRSRLDEAAQTKVASLTDDGQPVEPQELPEGPVPESVKVAAAWKDPVEEITPEFLDQLADDWDRTPSEVDKIATATALAAQAAEQGEQEKDAVGKALVGGLAAAGGLAAGAAGGLHKGKQMGVASEQAKDPAQIQMAYNVGAHRGWNAAHQHQRQLAGAQPAAQPAAQQKKKTGSVASLVDDWGAAEVTPPAPQYSPLAKQASTVVRPTLSGLDLLLTRGKQAERGGERRRRQEKGADGAPTPDERQGLAAAQEQRGRQGQRGRRREEEGVLGAVAVAQDGDGRAQA